MNAGLMPIPIISGDCTGAGFRSFQLMPALPAPTAMGQKDLGDAHTAIMMHLTLHIASLKSQ
jgi:hypothetical protein